MKSATVLALLLGSCLVAAETSAAEGPRILTLDEAVGMALERNPEVAEAQSRLAEAEARLEATRALGQPWLRARGAYDYWTVDQRPSSSAPGEWFV